MSHWTATALAALAAVGAGWIAVAALAEGPARERLEWLTVCALHVALGAGSAALGAEAWRAGHTALPAALGALALLFAAGLAVSLGRTFAVLAGRGGR